MPVLRRTEVETYLGEAQGSGKGVFNLTGVSWHWRPEEIRKEVATNLSGNLKSSSQSRPHKPYHPTQLGSLILYNDVIVINYIILSPWGLCVEQPSSLKGAMLKSCQAQHLNIIFQKIPCKKQLETDCWSLSLPRERNITQKNLKQSKNVSFEDEKKKKEI